MRIRHTFVYNEARSERLDTFLSKALSNQGNLTWLTRTQVSNLIKEKGVHLKDRSVKKPGTILRQGEAIDIDWEVETAVNVEPCNGTLDVIYEDTHILVINKPAGLVVHPGAGNKKGTLLNMLVGRYGEDFLSVDEEGRGGIVHRLDKDTTGVLVVAKDHTSKVRLSQQFAERKVRKTYVALAYSSPKRSSPLDQDQGELKLCLARDRKDPKKVVVSDYGKESITRWEILERYAYGVLVKLFPHTGRQHQLRVVLSHIGNHIIGDPKYSRVTSMPKRLQIAIKEFKRQALHAERIELIHPFTGEKVSFEARMPTDMIDLIDAFKNYG